LPDDLSIVDLIAWSKRLCYEQRCGSFTRSSVGFFIVDITLWQGNRTVVDNIQDLLARYVSHYIETFNGATPTMVGTMRIHAIAVSDAVFALFRKSNKGKRGRFATNICQICNPMGFKCGNDTRIFLDHPAHRI